ncbi:MAG: hypothetical protein ACRDHP_19735 [Ktedonobacterales bacterium]
MASNLLDDSTREPAGVSYPPAPPSADTGSAGLDTSLAADAKPWL